MSNEIHEKLGRLLALAEQADSRLDHIERVMVTRPEFERAYSEHKPIIERIDALESERDKGAFLRKIGDRVLFVAVGIITTAVVSALLGII